MKLLHRFSEEDKARYWSSHQFCGLCGSNQMCSLHHIESGKSADIHNSIMLCHVCHKKADSFNVRGGIEGKKLRDKMLAYTKRWIISVESEYI